MSGFQAEHPFFTFTLVASATLTAGDPVTGAGAKATGPTDFVGVALADAASGEHVPVCSVGIVNVLVDSSSIGFAAGARIEYATDGYDSAGAGNGFAFALDAGVASGYARILLGVGHASAA